MSASGPYIVQYDPKALKELTKIDKPAARRIVKAIDALSRDRAGQDPSSDIQTSGGSGSVTTGLSTRSKTRNL